MSEELKLRIGDVVLVYPEYDPEAVRMALMDPRTILTWIVTNITCPASWQTEENRNSNLNYDVRLFCPNNRRSRNFTKQVLEDMIKISGDKYKIVRKNV